MSRSAFAARFTELVGEPVMQYVTRWRMQVALDWLQHDDVPVAELAARLGYESEAAFSRAFKRTVGISPGAAAGPGPRPCTARAPGAPIAHRTTHEAGTAVRGGAPVGRRLLTAVRPAAAWLGGSRTNVSAPDRSTARLRGRGGPSMNTVEGGGGPPSWAFPSVGLKPCPKRSARTWRGPTRCRRTSPRHAARP